ncbi:alpha-amylase family glycosyl hydrolase [Pseudofrankia sp. BMG5.37]|uniref:alpha-amylase family glycosyl hydrolase n=1 Tax=Pseudofrankia sp. BMG5.37 TaxID=3050035 RepID=UPI00289606CB|nr:alpha-amylase family glycosyl hydrolase [Pseudofrankia sp. BMG5.37]MDT3440506.1 alpha-amylase family glycosyl hydrolase [Pseudofrankia sp. BMG5.37]
MALTAGWCRDAVFYEVYVRSFADGDGDGVGDLDGIRARLPDLAELGVDGLWLTPFYRSPMADHGYDVADHRDVDPLFGDLAAFDALLTEAHRLGLAVLVDLVPNHSSDAHPAFQAALAAPPGDPARHRYLIRPGRGPGGAEPPNNWISVFGGRAWTRLDQARRFPVPTGSRATATPTDQDAPADQDADAPASGDAPAEWYLHLFAPEQPDWDWSDPAVRTDHERTLRFWLDRGVDGFRIDVSHGLVKDGELRDNPPGPLATPESGFREKLEPHVWDQEGVHDVYRSWRAIVDGYGRARTSQIGSASSRTSQIDSRTSQITTSQIGFADPAGTPSASSVDPAGTPSSVDPAGTPGREPVLIGETWVEDPDRLARYVRADELNLTFSFSLLAVEWSAPLWRQAIQEGLAAMAAVGAPPTWVLANHDVVRPVTRYGGGAAGLRRARAALVALLALPGAVFLYQGDELALPQVDVPPEARQDPVWERSGHASPGRDGCRVPLPWSGHEPPFGFAAPGVVPWLPQPAGWSALTVEAQRADPSSTWWLVRSALAVRRSFQERPDGVTGLQWPRVPESMLAFDRLVVATEARPRRSTPSGALTDAARKTLTRLLTNAGHDGPSPVGQGAGLMLSCLLTTNAEARVPMTGQLLLASDRVKHDGETLVMPPDTAAWIIRAVAGDAGPDDSPTASG